MPFIVFFSVALVAYEVLYAVAPLTGIHYLVDVPLLSAVFSDYRSRLGWFAIREEEGVVGDVPFKEVHVEAREGVQVVG